MSLSIKANNLLVFTITLLLISSSLIYGQIPDESCPSSSVSRANSNSGNCNPKVYGDDPRRIVCVCNVQSCPPIGDVIEVKNGQVTVYESNQDGLRFLTTTLNQSVSSNEVDPVHGESCGEITVHSSEIVIDTRKTYQKIIGFGGAFTDSTGINVLSLKREVGKNIIRDYFDKSGLNYTIGRVPIGGSDFSTRPYSYDDDHPGDLNLTHFALAEEDQKYKIPFLKEALELKPNLKLFGSAWAPPAWMKTSDDIAIKGGLKGHVGGEYYQAWADYHVKFLDAYRKQGIEFWGLTTGNEPIHGLLFSLFNNLAFSPEQSKDFVKENLGPTLERTGYWPKLKIIMLDDQLLLAPIWVPKLLDDSDTAKYISGIGFHWYANNFLARFGQDWLRKSYPDYFWMSTEACEGYRLGLDPEKVILGSWKRAENYASDIIEDLNHQTSGWVDWNMALDTTGGPNWAGNKVDSPIIVNSTANEYYRQPMYYALAHFTKFLPPDSIRVDASGSYNGIEHTAFLTPDENIVLIVMNSNEFPVELNILGDLEFGVKLIVSPRSIQTIVTKRVLR